MWLDFANSEWVGGELVVKDKSPNTNNAKLFTGKALSFDGVNDKVDISLQTFSGEFTVSMWVKKISSGTQDFMGRDLDGDNIIGSINNLNAFIKINYTSLSFVTPPIDFLYSRLVFTRDSNNDVRLYINGIESTTGSQSKSGDFKISTFGRQRTYYGHIILSDIQFYDKAWIAEDALFDYNNPNLLAIDNPDSNLVAADLKGYWALSEGDGLVAYDSSGQGNDGAITGATYVDKQDTIPQLGMMDWAKSTPVAAEVTLIQAPNNVGFDILNNALRLRENAFNLDGSGYAEVADDASLDVTNFTCSGWAKYSFLNTNSSWNVIYANGGNGHVASTFDVATETGGKLVSYISTVKLTSTSTFTEDEWFYFAVTRSGSDISMYINGNTTPEATGTQSASVNNSLPKHIGRDASTDRFYKNLTDGILIYNRALTATEITNNYNVGLATHS